jgi:hypothetical protein
VRGSPAPRGRGRSLPRGRGARELHAAAVGDEDLRLAAADLDERGGLAVAAERQKPERAHVRARDLHSRGLDGRHRRIEDLARNRRDLHAHLPVGAPVRRRNSGPGRGAEASRARPGSGPSRRARRECPRKLQLPEQRQRAGNDEDARGPETPVLPSAMRMDSASTPPRSAVPDWTISGPRPLIFTVTAVSVFVPSSIAVSISYPSLPPVRVGPSWGSYGIPSFVGPSSTPDGAGAPRSCRTPPPFAGTRPGAPARPTSRPES